MAAVIARWRIWGGNRAAVRVDGSTARRPLSAVSAAWTGLQGMPEVAAARRAGVPGRVVVTSPAAHIAGAERVAQVVAAVPDALYPALATVHGAAVGESTAAWPPRPAAVAVSAGATPAVTHWLAREAELANARALWHGGGRPATAPPPPGRLAAVADATGRAIGHLSVAGRPPQYAAPGQDFAAVFTGIGAALADARLLSLHALVWPWAPARAGGRAACAEFQSAATALAGAIAHISAEVDKLAASQPVAVAGSGAWAKVTACAQAQVRAVAAVARHHMAVAALLRAAEQADEAAAGPWRGIALQHAAQAAEGAQEARRLFATLRVADGDPAIVASTAHDLGRLEGATLALDAHCKLAAGLHLAAPALAASSRPVTAGPVWESTTPLFPLPRAQQEELAPAVRSASGAATASLKALDALPAGDATGGRWGDLGRPIAPPSALTLRTLAALQFASGRAVLAEGLLSGAIGAAADVRWFDARLGRTVHPPAQLPSSTVAGRLCDAAAPFALTSAGVGLGAAFGFLLRQWDRRETAGHRELDAAASADASLRGALGLQLEGDGGPGLRSWRTAPSLLHAYLRSQEVAAPLDAAHCTVGGVGMAWPHALLDALVGLGAK